MRTWTPEGEERKAGRDCPMCAEGRPAETPFGISFFEGTCSSAQLRRGHWQRGYAFVIWRGRHVAEVTELSEDEAATYWREVLAAARAIEAHRPAKLNILMLGNETPHLHTHLVPRYLDDPAPGRPLHEVEHDAEPITEEELHADVTTLARLTGVLARNDSAAQRR